MSFQRICEFARKINTPVIVTDASGRDPWILMPLEEYARALQPEEGSEKETRRMRESEPNASSQWKTQNGEESVWGSAQGGDETLKVEESLPLEDQFFVEPLE